MAALPLRDARRSQERLGRRAEEGLPQARPPVPPGQEPGRRGRGGSASRRCSRPTTCSATPRSASSTTPSARRERTAGADATSTSPTSTSATSSAASSAAAAGAVAASRPAASAAADVEVEVRVSFEDALRGHADDGPGDARARLPHLPRHRRRPRHGAQDVPASATAPASSRPRRASSPCSSPARTAAASAPSSTRPARPATARAASGVRSATASRSRPGSRTARRSS